MLGFLGIVRGSAYTPFRTVRTFKGNVEGWGFKDLWDATKILVVHSVRKPRYQSRPGVGGEGGIADARNSVSGKGYLALVIWEIKNNNRKEIILTVLLCCALGTEGELVVGYANGFAVAASRMIHRCWGGCRGVLRGEGELESAWEVGDLGWGTVCTFPGRVRLEVVPCNVKTWWPLSGDGKSFSRIRKKQHTIPNPATTSTHPPRALASGPRSSF